MAEPLLIVSADDFGLTPGICDAILEAHRVGVVSSTSVLVTGPAFTRRAAALRDSGLPAGVHLAAVGEDPPMLTATEIPTLVDRTGRFPRSWRQFLGRALRRAVDPADLRREFTAQAEAFTSTGVRPTHLDTHQHLHLWPAVAAVVVEVAGAFEIPALRVPDAAGAGGRSLAVHALSPLLARRARRAGLAYPERTAGPEHAGRLTVERLVRAVERLGRQGAGSAELVTHPGPAADPELGRYRWGYQWDSERHALCSPAVRAAIDRAGFRLGSYADLTGAAAAGRGE